jgi:hypothetical protein
MFAKMSKRIIFVVRLATGKKNRFNLVRDPLKNLNVTLGQSTISVLKII